MSTAPAFSDLFVPHLVLQPKPYRKHLNICISGFLMHNCVFFNSVDKAKTSSTSGKKQFDKKLHATLLSEGVETPSKLHLSVSPHCSLIYCIYVFTYFIVTAVLVFTSE
jgi:hypothetical protein